MKITSILSKLPNWFDPNAPYFFKPEKWDGTRVRITVAVRDDPARELEAARKRAQKLYPGAILHVVPEYEAAAPAASIDLKGSDMTLLRNFLATQELPAETTIDQVVTYLEDFLPDASAFGVQGLHFLSAEGTQVLSYERVKIDFDREGLGLIVGYNRDWPGEDRSNGSGKTALVSLPFIALFGETLKGQKHDGWARQKTKDPCGVGLSTRLADNSLLRIVRGRRPNNFRVYVNEKEVTMGKPELTQELIKQLTNLTHEVMSVVYIGQDEVNAVFGTEKPRKELFSRLLGLNRFLNAQEKLAKIVTKRRRNVEDVEEEIHALEAMLSEAASGMTDIDEALAEQPVVTDKDVRKKKFQAEQLGFDITELTKQIAVIQEALDKNQKEFEKLLDESISRETRAKVLHEQLEATKKVEGKCPLCGSKVNVRTLEAHELEIRKAAAKLLDEVDRYVGEQEDNRTVRAALHKDLHDKQAAVKTKTAEKMSMQSDLNTLQMQLEARERLEKIRATKASRVEDLEHLQKLQEDARAQWVNEWRFAEFCAFAVGRNGLPAYLCAVVTPQLNSAAARYSEVFADSEISVVFEIAGGDIDVMIENRHGGETIKDQSKGEMRMAGIITAFAFRDVLVPHNLLVLDEPGDGLDPANAEAFARGLNSVVKRFKHVIVITHNERILSNLEPDYRIEVTKQNGISSVKYS